MAIRRWTRLILATIAALLLILVVLVPLLFNLDHYRPEVISYLRDTTGKPVDIGRLTLTLFPTVSIRIDDFRLPNPAEFPPGYFIKVGRIDAKLAAGALLRGQIIIQSLVLQDPVIDLISDPDGPWNFEYAPSRTSGKTLSPGVISKVEIRGGQLIASYLLASDAPGLVTFEVHNVASTLEQVDLGTFLNPSSSAVFSALGSLTADSLRFGRIQAANISSKLRLHAKEVSFTDVKGQVYGGNATGDLFFNLAGRNAQWNTNARVSSLDTAHLLAAFPNARGKMTGKLEGDMKLAGEIEHSFHPFAGIHGTGHVTVRNGQVPSLKLNVNLMKLARYEDLGPAARDPSSFSSISTDMELANLRISSTDIDVVGYGVNAEGSGSVSVSGSDSLDYQGVAEILTKQSFLTNLVARLHGATLKDGKLSFPFRVGGTIQNPKFSMGKKPD